MEVIIAGGLLIFSFYDIYDDIKHCILLLIMKIMCNRIVNNYYLVVNIPDC